MSEGKSGESKKERESQLTPEQYKVTRKGFTEPPFSRKYYDCGEPGIYRCVCCGNELFSSQTKFHSGTGWASFYAPIDSAKIGMKKDQSHGMDRTEVICSKCGAHLGHIFEDGPKPAGKRFCINSVVLKLDKTSKKK